MSERSVTHDTFVIEKEYPFPASKVFNAWASSEQKTQWFGTPAEDMKHELDFRVGGVESAAGAVGEGMNFSYNALYKDIIENERIVYTYEMHLNGDRISISVTTVEFKENDGRTSLTMTEQGVFLDGLDNPLQRKEGTVELLDLLGKVLAQ